MKNGILTAICGFLMVWSYSQSTTMTQWLAILNTAGISADQVYKTCEHFPHFSQYKDDAAFAESVASWETKYPEEARLFFAIPEIKAINPSPYYLGLTPSAYVNEPIHAYWQWIEGSDISEAELMSFAPHFPIPEKTTTDKTLYELEIKRWIYLYGHEYEAMLNYEKLTASNPYYEGYVDAIQIPKFMSALSSREKPEYINTGNPFEDQLRHDLQMQNWVFVFHPEEFEETYGFYPVFPEWHTEKTYRAQILDLVEKKEEQKKQKENKD